jgi:hypothetical protein
VDIQAAVRGPGVEPHAADALAICAIEENVQDLVIRCDITS